MLYTSPWAGFDLTTSVVIGTDSIGSGKSNYHMITATAAPEAENQVGLMLLFKIMKYHQIYI